MKKLYMTLLALMTCGAVQALPLRNPTEAALHTTGAFWDGGCCDPCDPCFCWMDWFSFRAGFYGDYVFNRNLELDNGSKADIEKTEIHTNAGLVALNVCDFLDFFATFGATDFHLSTPGSTFLNAGSNQFMLETETYFSWSVGGSLALWECGGFGLGVEGQYFQTCPNVTYVREEGEDPLYLNDVEFKYYDWQVGVGTSYRFDVVSPCFAMIPYMGITWSGAKAEIDDSGVNNVRLADLEAKKLWGYAVGMTLLGGEMISVTGEVRLADQKEAHVNMQFRF